MNIGIIPNKEKDNNFSVTKRLVKFIIQNECNPYLEDSIAALCGYKEYSCDELFMYKNCNFIIVLGGDGTILDVGRKTAVFGTPILGINMGHLGFLTTAEESDAEETILKVLKKDFKIEKRLMLKARINSFAKDDEIIALNEFCMSRGIFSKMVDITVFVNNEYLDTFKADGIIVSTPTGSTAYNLSAGGPVLKPDTQIIAITPICPHTLSSRPIVVSSNDSITIQINSNNSDFILSADGQECITLLNKNEIQIKRWDYYTSIIKTTQFGFYDILREKLARNGR